MISQSLTAIRFAHRPATLLSAIVITIAWFCFATLAEAQWELSPDQTQKVEAYLNRINADELLVEHLESAAAGETDSEARQKLAGRLLGLYAQRIMSGRAAEDSKWRGKSELILKTYPKLDNNSIRIAMLQSKYREGEISFQNWWKQGRPAQQRAAQQELWSELTDELTNLNSILENSYQDQIAARQSQGADIDSKEIIRTEGLLLHTNYLLGWAAYFTGVLNPNQLKPNLKKADAWFRDFLQIEPKKLLTDVPETWFDFTSPWQVRALVGLAMVQHGLNYPTEGQYCFDLVEKNSSDQRTRDSRHVWDFNSRIYLNDYAGASELVNSIASSNQLSKNGRVSYWTTVTNSGLAIRSSAPVVARNFLSTGLTGLAREFQSAQIADFLDQNQLQLADAFGDDENNFEALWISGLLEFHNAQASDQTELLPDSKSKLVSAIAAATDSTIPLDVQKCKFVIAKIDHLHRNYSDAADAFLDVSLAFDPVDRELAAEAQWLATRSLAELSRRDSRRLLDTNRAIDSIIRRFPGSTFAKRAEFEKLRVNLISLSPEEAVKRLSEIPEQSLNYPVALNEIVKRRYEDWLQHFQTKSDQESQKIISLCESELSYRRLESATDQSKIKTTLLVVDALLRLENFDPLQVRQRLDVAKRFVDLSESSGNLYFEYRYYEFLFANRAGETDRAQQQAIWLSENAKGTRFEKSALVLLAQTADQRYRQSVANNSATTKSTKELVSIFERLVSVLGSSPQLLTSAPNARVAYARLAELHVSGGNSKKAIEMFNTLKRLFPNNKNYLVNLGRAHSQAEGFEAAIPVWRKLAAGVQAGTELWFESKLNLAIALFKTGNQKDSQTLIDQTVRLSPEMPDKWKQEFDNLASKIE